MGNSFRQFLDAYLNVWKNSSLEELKDIISIDYKAREISDSELVDFGYEEALTGWEQGFYYVKESDNEWDLNEVAIIPLHDNEMMAILSATMIIEGKRLDNVSLFFQTFTLNENDNWKLIRSYIEAGVPRTNLKEVQFN